ncbi:iron complex transport system ATP-binding protein [Mariprofundus micogutta]|uniref:Iron complex transport system ATP-binding protein n=1 Tax=Mariprofundus micogutta TaxID=1921010 RepID=A0A1L8CL96_9PROT|nr:ABC transporter ATP-binding protein [Mariprofundus micogutta]GAV19619.1 iron complex transport system ATP-binding protein [Mariprofundus micogutta]
MENLMHASRLSLQRGDDLLFNNLNLYIRSAEITVILGPNGAGKSSLLLALAGLIPADGDLQLQATAMSEYSRMEIATKVAWQGELPPTEFGLTVKQRLNLASDGEENLIPATKAMEIEALLNRPLAELSSGERQRVELAALMLRPAPIWLLDEPTAHLDIKHQVQCLNMMKKQANAGRAIVTVLHDLQQAMAVADQVVLIDGQGHAEAGPAGQMLDVDRLASLFDTPLIRQGKLLMPEYGDGI